MSPLMLTTGRADLTDKLSSQPHRPTWTVDGNMPNATHLQRLSVVCHIRAEMIAWGARNMTQLAIERNVRNGESEVFEGDRPIRVWNPKVKLINVL